MSIVKENTSTVASGKAATSQIVSIKEIKLGDHVFPKKTINRSNANLAGLDLLGSLIFQQESFLIQEPTRQLLINDSLANIQIYSNG
ncbi:MAG: hypothetical protein JNL11_18435 [Bdellovibrionaceae bacterium]|nr:hypothetical protein [Pseudobdellovibrionaceae bacterium]